MSGASEKTDCEKLFVFLEVHSDGSRNVAVVNMDGAKIAAVTPSFRVAQQLAKSFHVCAQVGRVFRLCEFKLADQLMEIKKR